MSINRNLKRLIREYEFLLEDMDDVLEIHKTANQELNRAIRMAKDDDIADSEFEKDEEEEEEVETFEDTPERKILKKLFRKIVFKCHPDRLPKDTGELERAEMQDLYEKAVMAHDRDNWGLMVVVAIKLDIKLPKEAEGMIDRIAEETEGLKGQISQLTGSFAWQWYHSENEMQKKMIDDYLNTLKKIKEKNAAEEKKEKKILVVGHPRTGTGYTAKLLQSWGLDVQHEKMGEDGTSDWSLVTRIQSLWQKVEYDDFKWNNVIYCVRDPRESIASIAYTEQMTLPFRKNFNRRIKNENLISSAIVSILEWDKMIASLNPSITYRIEDESEKLFKYLKDSGLSVRWNDSQVGIKYNVRSHPKLDDLLKEHDDIPNRFKRGINEFCRKYGYDTLF